VKTKKKRIYRKPAVKAPAKSEFQMKKDLYKHFVFNPLDYIQKMIIDLYNAATGKDVVISDQQKEAIEAVRLITTAQLKKYHKQPMTENEIAYAKKIGVSIMSGKGCGKDAVAAWLIIWFLDVMDDAKVPCTSVSADQLSKVLWSEIAHWMTHAAAKNRFTIQNDKFFRTDLPKKENVGKRWLAWPKTINPNTTDIEPEAIAGFHANNMMLVGDEVSGMKDQVCETLEGTLTSEFGTNFFLILFNPTRRKGYAIETQYKNSEYWITLQWDAEKSHITSKDNIERIEKKYGRESNTFRIRVKGLPPREDKGNLIPWDWIEEAMDREIEPLENDVLVKAVDCGAGVDPSIIATRKGDKVYPLKAKNTPDSNIIEGWVGTDIDSDNPDRVYVDTIGIGHHIGARLSKLKGNHIVKSADVRRKAEDPEQYRNKRASMFARLRDRFENSRIDLPRDDELADELGALRWANPDNIPLQMIDKRILRKELDRSTNKADAVGMLYFDDDEFISRSTIDIDDDDYVYSEHGQHGWLAH
jgi:hypothetical protein